MASFSVFTQKYELTNKTQKDNTNEIFMLTLFEAPTKPWDHEQPMETIAKIGWGLQYKNVCNFLGYPNTIFFLTFDTLSGQIINIFMPYVVGSSDIAQTKIVSNSRYDKSWLIFFLINQGVP